MAKETLSQPEFLVLLALGREPRHGYAILGEVLRLSGGAVSLGTGTLYGILRRFLDAGWIRRAADPEPPQHLRGRQAYALTAAGRRAAEAETRRLESLVRLSRRRLAPQEA